MIPGPIQFEVSAGPSALPTGMMFTLSDDDRRVMCSPPARNLRFWSGI